MIVRASSNMLVTKLVPAKTWNILVTSSVNLHALDVATVQKPVFMEQLAFQRRAVLWLIKKNVLAAANALVLVQMI